MAAEQGVEFGMGESIVLIKRRAALEAKKQGELVKVRHPSCLKPTEPLPSTRGINVARIPSLDEHEREERARDWGEYIERRAKEWL